jgi:uncharacterized membrane protein YdjX (TVP38/TMEM64 family)
MFGEKCFEGARIIMVKDQNHTNKLGLVFRRFWPLGILVIGILLIWAFDLKRYLTFSVLADNRDILIEWVTESGIIAVAIYICSYAVLVSFSIPGAVWVTIAGGFLFGPFTGALFAVTGATLGAGIVFIGARHVFSDFFIARFESRTAGMISGLKKHALSYLLFLRLIPIFPFFLVNLAPALLGVKFSTYLLATFFGIIPATVIYAHIGAGVGLVLERGGEIDSAIIFSPKFFGPLVAMGLLSLLPVIYRKIKK